MDVLFGDELWVEVALPVEVTLPNTMMAHGRWCVALIMLTYPNQLEVNWA